MKSSIKRNEFNSLLGALYKIQGTLESTSSPRVMLAAQTMEEFNNQKLPAHCKVTKRKLRGPRVPVRGRDRSRQPTLIARWPQDGLVEGTSPALLFVLDGQADIPIANYMVHCHAGDILFLPPGMILMEGSRPHYEKITPEAYCSLLFINIPSVGFHHLEVSMCHSKGDQHTTSNADESCWIASRGIDGILDIISEITQHGANAKSTYYLVAAIISLLLQELEQGNCFSNHDFPSQSSSMEGQTPILKALEYIQNHLYSSLTINIVARWVGLSRSTFVKQFREETNESFQEHLTQLRLKQAKVLLLQTNLPIEHLSKRVGLSSGQLRNLFRQECQCTPTEYRQSQTTT